MRFLRRYSPIPIITPAPVSSPRIAHSVHSLSLDVVVVLVDVEFVGDVTFVGIVGTVTFVGIVGVVAFVGIVGDVVFVGVVVVVVVVDIWQQQYPDVDEEDPHVPPSDWQTVCGTFTVDPGQPLV